MSIITEPTAAGIDVKTADRSHSVWFGSLICGIVALLIYLTPVHNLRGDLSGGDATPAELLPLTILQDHSLDFDPLLRDHPELAPGDLPFYLWNCDGRIVSFYPIVPGLMNVPAFAVARLFHLDLLRWRFVLSTLTAETIVALSVAFMFAALRNTGISPRPAYFFTAVYAFGTEAFSLASRALFQHGPSLLLLSAALAVLFRKNSRFAALAAFALGLAIWNRPVNLLLCAPLLLALFWINPAKRVSIVFAAALPLLGMTIYSYLYCGSIMQLGQGEKAVSDLNSGGGLRGPWLADEAGLLFSPNRGLLIFNPIFLLGIIYLAIAMLPRRGLLVERAMAIGLALSLVFYGNWACWWGGWCFGYRMLTELVPVLTIATALGWQRWLSKLRGLNWAFVLLSGFCIYIHSLGAFYAPSSEFNDEPDNIDLNPQRLWTFRNGELIRDQRLFNEDVASLLHGRASVAAHFQNILPPTGEALSPRLATQQVGPFLAGDEACFGGFDQLDSSKMIGWAWDPEHPNQPVTLILLADGQPLKTIVADCWRADLHAAGIGNGYHGFELPTPATLADGALHHLRAIVVSSHPKLSDQFTLAADGPATQP